MRNINQIFIYLFPDQNESIDYLQSIDDFTIDYQNENVMKPSKVD